MRSLADAEVETVLLHMMTTEVETVLHHMMTEVETVLHHTMMTEVVNTVVTVTEKASKVSIVPEKTSTVAIETGTGAEKTSKMMTPTTGKAICSRCYLCAHSLNEVASPRK